MIRVAERHDAARGDDGDGGLADVGDSRAGLNAVEHRHGVFGAERFAVEFLDEHLHSAFRAGKLKDKECGISCERIHVPDYPDFDSLYRYFKEKGFCTIEDLIIQHPALRKLYANAVNSMRIITILDNWGKPHVVYIVQKMGLNGSIVDNNCLFARVDPETGKIAYPAHSGDTTKGIIYYEHPETHVPLVGYQIPYVKEAVKMCLEASLVVPQVRYIGWDVAVTEKGPVIIEGNTFNAHDFWQLPPHTPDGIGMLPVIKKLVPDFKCHYKG